VISNKLDSPAPNYAELAPVAPEGEIPLYGFFPKAGEIEIEIGTGRGMFLLERARLSPDSYILGIEIKKKWAYKVSERCRKEGLDRACVMAGDARSILSRINPEKSVSRIFLHFPDPWWKKRHTKRRVMNRELLDDIIRLLKPSGELFIQTDVEERANDYIATVTSRPELTLLGDKGFLNDNPYGARSNRERRAQKDGIPIYRILATRTNHQTIQR
jgi:tRNA (guanine-N7-)-methyltransferase